MLKYKIIGWYKLKNTDNLTIIAKERISFIKKLFGKPEFIHEFEGNINSLIWKNKQTNKVVKDETLNNFITDFVCDQIEDEYFDMINYNENTYHKHYEKYYGN